MPDCQPADDDLVHWTGTADYWMRMELGGASYPSLQRSVQPPRILAGCDEPMANGNTDIDKHTAQ